MNKVAAVFVITCVLWLLNIKDECNAGIISKVQNLDRNGRDPINITTQNTQQLPKSTPLPEEPMRGCGGEGGGKGGGGGEGCGGGGGFGGVFVESEWRCPEGQHFEFGACRVTED